MSSKSKPYAGKPAGGRPFVVPDRKAQGQAQNSKPKPQGQGYHNKPKFSQSQANNKPAWSRPLVVPDRKQQVQQAKSTSNGSTDNKAKSNGKVAFHGRRTWWENTDSADDLELIKFEEGQTWHTLLPAYLNDTDGHNVKLQGERLALATKLIDVAYQKQMKLYNESQKNSSEMKGDLKWMNDMIKSGTMSDKVAAMALKVQGSPFHELDTLDTLIGMALKKEQRSAQLAIEALKDLFVNNLLPERQLRALENNSLNHTSMTLSTALLVWFEAQLKNRYAKVLDALDAGLKSNVDFFKRECLQTISELLIGKPEQEARLLEMLVNKLGDPSRATCSKAVEALKTVVRAHPAMKIVVVREVRQFLYRPNLKIRPIFNGIILLSQVQLNKGDHAVAVQLVEGYLSLFEKTMKEEEYGSRLLSALLTGINKALPYLDNTDSLGKYVDPLFRIVHTATSFSTATQALMLLSHLALSISHEQSKGKGKVPAEKEATEEKGEETGEAQILKRYYRALYAKLLSDQITTRSRNTLFLNLLYRSIKGDPLHHRAVAFLKRLLICAAQSVPPIAAGLLFLVSEIVRARPSLKECLANIPEQPAVASGETDKEFGEDGGFLGNFNVLKREPEFAYASDAQPSVWEISLLRRHFHPSVAMFATSLLDGPEHHIEFGGDPTVEFSLMAFLNRFAYKNPKKNLSERIKHRTAHHSEEPLNLTLTHKDAAEVDPDQQFFHKYFSDKQQLVAEGRSRRGAKRTTEEEEGNDEYSDGDASDPDEAAIDRYADKLAEDLMRSADGNRDEEDVEFSDEDDSDEGSAVMGPEDEVAGDSDSEDGQDFDQGLESGSDSEEEEEEEVSQKKSKGTKVTKVVAAKGKKDSATSDAFDFVDFVAEHAKKAGKTAKKSNKRDLKASDDSSDDDYQLETYGDEENVIDENYNGFEDDSLVNSDIDVDSDLEVDEHNSDFDEPDSDEAADYEDDEEDNESGSQSDGGMEFDESDDEALEDAALFDSDNEQKARSAKKGKKFEKVVAKGKTNKKARGADSDFASAEDYEDMMEEILQSVVAPSKSADAEKSGSKKKGKEEKGKVAEPVVKEVKGKKAVPVVDNKKRKEPVAAPAAAKSNAGSKKQKKI